MCSDAYQYYLTIVLGIILGNLGQKIGQKKWSKMPVSKEFLNQYICAHLNPTVHIQDSNFSLGHSKTPSLEVYHHISPYIVSVFSVFPFFFFFFYNSPLATSLISFFSKNHPKYGKFVQNQRGSNWDCFKPLKLVYLVK